MSASINQTVLKSAKFHRCVDDVAQAFQRNDGEVCRARFRQLCRDGEYDPDVIQAYFESAGLHVIHAGKHHTNQDRYVWDPS